MAMRGSRHTGRRATTALTAGLICAGMALAASPAFAVSETYCFPDTSVDPSCDDGSGSLQGVFNLAANDTPADHDTILLGAGAFDVPGNQGYNEGAEAGNTVEIRGAGASNTVLTLQDTSGMKFALGFTAPAGSTLSDLGIVVTAADDGNGDQGLNLGGQGLTHDVAVTGPAATNVQGVFMQGEAALDDSLIDMGPDNSPENYGVRAATGNVTVTDSVLSGDYAAEEYQAGSSLTIERSTLRGERGLSALGGTIVARSSVIEMGNITNARGIDAKGDGDTEATVIGENLTIFGGGSGTNGVRAIADSAVGPQITEVTLNSTLIDDVGTAIFVGADEGDASTVTTSFSNYDEPTVVDNNLDDMGPDDIATLTENTRTTHPVPQFVDSPAGDFHLLPASPLIDIGDPAAPGAGAFDLDAQARALPGTAACPGTTGRRDIGADEYAGAAVLDCAAPDTTVSGKKKVAAKKKRAKVTFTLASTETATFECSLDGAAFSPCASPFSTKAKRGKHTLTVRAKDSSGNQDATPASFAFTINKKKAKKKK